MLEGKKKIAAITAAVIGVILIAFLVIMSLKISGDKIVKNTSIGNVEIGGLTKEQAKQEIQKSYKFQDIKLKYDGKEWVIAPSQIDIDYDLNKTVGNAFNSNRKDGYFTNLKNTISYCFGSKNTVLAVISYDETKLKNEMNTISKEINREVENATIKVKNEQITVVPEKNGRKLDVDKSIKTLKAQVGKEKFKDKLAVNEEQAKVKKEDLKEIDTTLASYSTTFSTGQVNRSYNIAIASKSLNNIVIKPGEEFSFNNTTGKRIKSNGYKSAPVIENGEMQLDYGGGVCQVSSTLYNSVLLSGLDIVHVKNHTIPSGYVIKGRDATVADSGIDFLFKNNFDHPVFIKSHVDGNTLYTVIYGNKADKKYVEITTSVDGVSSTGYKRVSDPSMPAGKEKIDKNGRNAYSVSTYRIFKDKDGKVIKKEKVASSYYPKKEGVILVGTAKAPEEDNDNTNDAGGSNMPNPPSGGGSSSGGSGSGGGSGGSGSGGSGSDGSSGSGTESGGSGGGTPEPPAEEQ
ncbi:VanW family protein [Metaclostridioides mangenotii]|uniref:VanW family protein n=1 Tax=Metaclostridioides mangenotii TaxID=1540 RepID=UPI0028EFCF2B|nr:VanW family protein [Clostridioides mangenotii]